MSPREVFIRDHTRQNALLRLEAALELYMMSAPKIPDTVPGRARVQAFVEHERAILARENAIFEDLPDVEVSYRNRMPIIRFR